MVCCLVVSFCVFVMLFGLWLFRTVCFFLICAWVLAPLSLDWLRAVWISCN